MYYHLCMIYTLNFILSRALVRAGATGAWAPSEIWQRVQGTRPDKGAILLNKKNTPKLYN